MLPDCREELLEHSPGTQPVYNNLKTHGFTTLNHKHHLLGNTKLDR
ncbi:MAG: hypothetical protein VKK80_09220 [Prochlorothrix sp.]|nr:hypothetical protein [Prochlorothrix sp.]